MTSPTATTKTLPNYIEKPEHNRPNRNRKKEPATPIQNIVQGTLTEIFFESTTRIPINVTNDTQVSSKMQEVVLDLLPDFYNQLNENEKNEEAKKLNISNKNFLDMIGQLTVQFNPKLASEPKFVDPKDHHANYKELVQHYAKAICILDVTVNTHYQPNRFNWASQVTEDKIIKESALNFNIPSAHIKTIAHVLSRDAGKMNGHLKNTEIKHLNCISKYIEFLEKRLESESTLLNMAQTMHAKLGAFQKVDPSCTDETFQKLAAILERLKACALNLNEIKIQTIQNDFVRNETNSLSKEISSFASACMKSRHEFRNMANASAPADLATIKIHYETIKSIYISFENRVVRLHEMMAAIMKKWKEEVDRQEPHAALLEGNLISNAIILHLTPEDYKQNHYLPFVSAHTKREQELAQIEVEINALMNNCARAYKEVQDINDCIQRDGYFVTETRRGASSFLASYSYGLIGVARDPEVKYPFDMQIVAALPEENQVVEKK